MKAKLLFSCLFLSFAFVALQAQDVTKSGAKTAFQPNGFWDNWFIQLGAGGQTLIAEEAENAFSTDAVTLAPTFSVGKWFQPYLGVRLKGEGGALHSFLNDDQAFMLKNTYYGGHLDLLWNVTNYWGKYSPKRVFNFIPYAGLGYMWRESSDQAIPVNVRTSNTGNQENFTVHGGLMFLFRLSNHVGFHIDLAGMLTDDYMNRIVTGRRYEGVASATAGFTFNLGKTDFETCTPMDYGLVNDLNNKINSLRNQVDELSKRPVSCPKCPDPQPVKVEEKVVSGAPTIVSFRVNSAQIDANQKVNIYNTAQFMKNNSGKIKVIGYADKGTGTSTYNMKLSEQRAKAVAKELTSKYNIPSENIIVEWKGSNVQPYSENNWNRVVIMNAE